MTLDRARARLDFIQRHLGAASAVEPASSDASFRSYWRVSRPGAASLVVMDAPPPREDVRPWLDIDRRLRAAGLHAPEVLAADAGQGLVLIEDLGTRTYLPELDADSADRLYADALDALLVMQTRVDTTGLPAYDRTRLVDEMELMPKWFLGRHLGFSPSCDDWDLIEAAFTLLAQSALEQPRAFVHRDYHSRNLLVTGRDAPVTTDAGLPGPGMTAPGLSSPWTTDSGLPSPGIIDFQDAVTGPVTYDLVSLLRDCYIAWDGERVDGWLDGYRQRLVHAHLLDTGVDGARFRRWFDLMGLQRHLKVLGIFCRLWYRDGKAGYLADLPLVWHYVTTVAQHYPELTGFIALLERVRSGRDLTRPAAATGTRA
jgi:aminoglycoside/choline kinase family phosphotransferase